MKRFLLPSFLALLVLFVACSEETTNQEQDENPPQELQPGPESLSAIPVVENLSIPWGMDFLPSGNMLYTEKSGTLYLFDGSTSQTVTGLPSDIVVQGQGGLLDVAVHPDFENQPWIYMTYASDDGSGSGAHTKLARARLSGNTLTNLQTLYKATPNSSSGAHFGSRIVFRNDYVFFGIGDRGNRDVNPQDLGRDGGKIYRLNMDGSIPANNPFVGNSNAISAVYSYGHRNPQGMVVDPETNQIFESEHGPKGGDEINIISPGNNYGWPVVTYGENYDGTPITDQTSAPGMTQPEHYWVPSIAPSGHAIINSEVYGDWKGNHLVGSLRYQYLEMLRPTEDGLWEREKLVEDIGRLRDVSMGPDGYIYIAVEGRGIYKLVPDEE